MSGKKTIIVYASIFLIRLLISCTTKPPDPIQMEYNSLNVRGVDNGGEYISYTETDTMYSNAVAMQLILSDTVLHASAWYVENLKSFGFGSALAYEPITAYRPQVKVRGIKVFTLQDLNATYTAGADITDEVLYSLGESNALYHYPDEVIPFMNNIQSYSSVAVFAVLKIPVENTSAQFKIEVVMEDEHVITATSKLFAIKRIRL